jgi:hypothetical protein
LNQGTSFIHGKSGGRRSDPLAIPGPVLLNIKNSLRAAEGWRAFTFKSEKEATVIMDYVTAFGCGVFILKTLKLTSIMITCSI